jgi:hypothetical protein
LLMDPSLEAIEQARLGRGQSTQEPEPAEID